MIIHTTPPIERMLRRKVVNENGCWIWPGSLNAGNYGTIREEKRGPLLMVHRVSYEHFVGPIPEGFQVEHACHTGDQDCLGGDFCDHRPCWNPQHLTLLSHADNSKLGRSRNMQTFRSGVCQRNHDLSVVGTYTWTRPSGTVRHQCAECVRESLRRRRAARKAG